MTDTSICTIPVLSNYHLGIHITLCLVTSLPAQQKANIGFLGLVNTCALQTNVSD